MSKVSITNRDLRFYELAYKVARLSNCVQKHGAVIVSNSRVFSLACNRSFTSGKGSLHAEERAIHLSRAMVKGTTVYCARITGQGNCQPCKHCREVMIDAGIRIVVYFDGIGLVKEIL